MNEASNEGQHMSASKEQGQLNAEADLSRLAERSHDIFNLLRQLRIGAQIEAQFLFNKPMRCHLELVGIIPGSHVIMRLCNKQPAPEFDIESGISVVLRGVLENDLRECIAFRSQLLSIMCLPSRLLFFRYPEQVQVRQLRSYSRCAIDLPAQLKVNHKKADNDAWQAIGQIKDLSLGGCRFECNMENSKLKVNHIPVVVKFTLPESNDSFQLDGLVQNSRVKESLVVLGIEFNDRTQEVRKIFERIAGVKQRLC